VFNTKSDLWWNGQSEPISQRESLRGGLTSAAVTTGNQICT
jgi:hypothetical protein